MRVVAILGLVAVLCGCVTAPDKPDDPQIAWERRQSILKQQPTWDLTGKLAVHAAQEGWFAGLDWQQRGEQFQIDLKDSFGRIVARIEGDNNGVVLTQHDGSTVSAATPEQLTRELYGFPLPLSGLRYWVRGIPAPNGDSEQSRTSKSLDSYGRLSELQQAGWAVDYQEYQEAEPVALPEKISVSGHDLRVKLVIDGWKTAAPPES
jgi:outer membrane lipoprotein LolB